VTVDDSPISKHCASIVAVFFTEKSCKNHLKESNLNITQTTIALNPKMITQIFQQHLKQDEQNCVILNGIKC
jgi:hypothetical protein